eukprot:64852-Hanusia_phi.AAC.4
MERKFNIDELTGDRQGQTETKRMKGERERGKSLQHNAIKILREVRSRRHKYGVFSLHGLFEVHVEGEGRGGLKGLCLRRTEAQRARLVGSSLVELDQAEGAART